MNLKLLKTLVKKYQGKYLKKEGKYCSYYRVIKIKRISSWIYNEDYRSSDDIIVVIVEKVIPALDKYYENFVLNVFGDWFCNSQYISKAEFAFAKNKVKENGAQRLKKAISG